MKNGHKMQKSVVLRQGRSPAAARIRSHPIVLMAAMLRAAPLTRGAELRGVGRKAQASGAGLVQASRSQRAGRRRSGVVTSASLGDSGLIYPPSVGDGVVLPPFPAAMARTPVEMNSSSPAAQNATSSYTGACRHTASRGRNREADPP